MPRVVHFDIPADDPERAAKFYREVFGWEIVKWGGPEADYWLVSTGPEGEGINGGIGRRGMMQAVSVTVDVPSVEEAIAKVLGAGGKLLMPKTAVTGVGYMAHLVDPEGNTFSVMARDEAAR